VDPLAAEVTATVVAVQVAPEMTTMTVVPTALVMVVLV
jgi:hypothetical protein